MTIAQPASAEGTNSRFGVLGEIERSFDPRKRKPPSDVGEARAIVEKMLAALPTKEVSRLRNLAISVDFKYVVGDEVRDRIYCALATAADHWYTTPEQLALQIISKRSCVGLIMTQAG